MSHLLHWYALSQKCAFKCLVKLLFKKKCNIDCINCLIGCTYMAFPRMWFLNVLLEQHSFKNVSHCLHWYSLSQLCVNIWSLRINYGECALSHPLYFYDLSLKFALKCILKSLFFWKKIVTLNTLIWYLSNLCWHMVFKTPSYCEFLITLAALIFLLHRLCFQIRKLNIG